jgi:hypothetical protein
MAAKQSDPYLTAGVADRDEGVLVRPCLTKSSISGREALPDMLQQ